MADYNRDRSGGGNRGGRGFGGGGGRDRSGGRPGFGRHGRDEDRPQMFKAICAECGDRCEVPFRPTGERPVLCRDCFGGGNDRRGPSRDNRDRGERGGRGERADRDNRREFIKEPANDFSKEQFDMLNAKLDRILKLITPVISVSKEEQAEVAKKPAKKSKKKPL